LYSPAVPDRRIIALAFTADLHYMRRNKALVRLVHRPPLDDIPAVGIPFPENRKEKHDVDHC